LNSFAAPSSAGRDSSISVSREEDKDAKEDRNELVVLCSERNVEYDVWVKEVSDDVRVCDCVVRDCGVERRVNKGEFGRSVR